MSRHACRSVCYACPGGFSPSIAWLLCWARMDSKYDGSRAAHKSGHQYSGQHPAVMGAKSDSELSTANDHLCGGKVLQRACQRHASSQDLGVSSSCCTTERLSPLDWATLFNCLSSLRLWTCACRVSRSGPQLPQGFGEGGVVPLRWRM